MSVRPRHPRRPGPPPAGLLLAGALLLACRSHPEAPDSNSPDHAASPPRASAPDAPGAPATGPGAPEATGPGAPGATGSGAPGATASGARATGAPGAGAASPQTATPSPVDWTRSPYPWLAEAASDAPGPVEAVATRFAPPAGFARVAAEAGSFGAWLRGLPLTAAGTPVRTFRGAVLRDANHPYVSAVVALDVGAADLQQCADSVIRLHAEWRWSQGDRAQSYRAASGTPMPYARWARGERMVGRGLGIAWEQTGRSGEDHGGFRRYLDAVFTWANTGSLARDGAKVAAADLRPGDFFVLPGSPGHAVLVLDLAKAADGRRLALLGQGFMPAQSFHVLRSPTGSAWFVVDEAQAAVATPFWEPFPWSALRRLDGP